MNDKENKSNKNGADFAESLIREMFAATPLFAYLALVAWAKTVIKTFEERQRVLQRPPSLKELFQVMDEITPKVLGDFAIATRSAKSILAEATKRNGKGTGKRVSGDEPVARDSLSEMLRIVLAKVREDIPPRYRGIAEDKTAELLPEIRLE